MSVKRPLILSLFLFIFCSSVVYANNNLYLKLSPSVTAKSYTNNLFETSLGIGCYVMLGIEQVLPCNPALMGEVSGKRFQVSYMIGDDYKFISKGIDLLAAEETYEFAKSLYNKKDLVDTETVFQLSYRYHTFGLELVPYKTSFWILSRNSSNPRVAIQAVSEKSIAGTVGGMLNDHHSVGLKLRYLYREVAKDEFSFLEASHSGRDLLQKKSHSAVSIEPGYAYFANNKWRTRLSAVIRNWEVQSSEVEGVKSEPSLIWGVALTPYDDWFVWDIGLAHEVSEVLDTGLTLTSQTHFKYISWFTKLATNNYSFGGTLRMRDLQFSMNYSEQAYEFIDQDLKRQQSFLFEASYTF